MQLFVPLRRITGQTVQRLFSTPPRINYGILNKKEKLSNIKIVNNKNNNPNSNIIGIICVLKDIKWCNAQITNLIKQDKPVTDLAISYESVINHKLFDIPDVKRKTFFESFLKAKLLAKTKDSQKGGPVRQSGGRFGKLDAANEAGFFHKNNRERLIEIKKKLKDKEKGPDRMHQRKQNNLKQTMQKKQIL